MGLDATKLSKDNIGYLIAPDADIGELMIRQSGEFVIGCCCTKAALDTGNILPIYLKAALIIRAATSAIRTDQGHRTAGRVDVRTALQQRSASPC